MAKGIEMDPFTPRQQVLLIDDNPVESDQIRAGISPKVLNVDSFDMLADTLTNRLSQDEHAFVTLIITKHIPGTLRTVWNSTITALNNDQINGRLFVYHITTQGVSPILNAIVVPSVTDFLELANNTHLEKLTEDDSLSEEAKKVIRELKIKLSKTSSDKDDLTEQLKQANSDLDDLKQRLKHDEELIKKYLDDKKSAEEQAEKAKKERDETNLDFESKTKTIAKLRSQILDLTEKVTSLETKSDADKRSIEEMTVRSNELVQQIKDLEDDLARKDEENKRFLSAKTEYAAMGELQKRYDATVDLLRDARNELTEKKSDLALKENQIESLRDQIDLYRDGTSQERTLGYDNVYQKIHLKRTNVMYFKVIDPLPFHRFYINEFVEQLREMAKGQGINQEIVIVMLKLDQGQDRKRYQDCSFIGDLEGVNSSNDKYYLIPSKRMGDNAYRFEEDGRMLIFIDYIDNEEIYLETDAIQDHYVILTHSSDLGRVYDLKGKTISNDHRSLINIRYNKSVNSMTSQNKQEYILDTLIPLIKDSNVVQDMFNI